MNTGNALPENPNRDFGNFTISRFFIDWSCHLYRIAGRNGNPIPAAVHKDGVPGSLSGGQAHYAPQVRSRQQ
jgi:hypothetical protein